MTFRSAIVIPLPQLLVPVKVLKIALKSGSECQNPGKTLSNSNVVVSSFVVLFPRFWFDLYALNAKGLLNSRYLLNRIQGCIQFIYPCEIFM